MTARRKALADAVCGVISSLVSMIAFYPVDVWKTSLQAECKISNEMKVPRHDANIINILSRVSELFRGLPHKIIHTMGSSFTYFFVYSLVQTKYTAYRRRCMSTSNISKISGSVNTSTSTKLLLTAFAAVINTCITLPLDTISSRKQAGTTLSSTTSTDSTIDESNRSLSNAEKYNDTAGNQYSKHRRQQQLYIKSPEKYKFSFSTNLADEAFATSNGNNQKQQQQKKLQSILSLWSGLFPATLLCTNPAIQYTMFDTLKNALLQHKLCRDTAARSSNQSSPTSNKSNTNKLSMWEAFVFGLSSKFVATIITYPLIRCKVMLMVSSPDAFEVEDDDDAKYTTATSLEEESRQHRCNDGQNGQDHHKIEQQEQQKQQKQTNRTSSTASITRADGRSTKYPKSLPLLLIHIFRRNGVRGIYKGCSLQLLHTVLKSALLLMVREKITSISYSAFRINDD